MIHFIQILFLQQDGQIDVKSKKRNKKKRKREKAEAKNQLYAGFTKSATLSGGRMIEEPEVKKDENSSSEDEEMDKFSAVTKILSDEELFKEAGITAHKGARHGCTMQAKLRRVEESDQKYLEEQAAKKKKKKKKKEKNLTH